MGKHPFLYLIHGYGGTEETWCQYFPANRCMPRHQSCPYEPRGDRLPTIAGSVAINVCNGANLDGE